MSPARHHHRIAALLIASLSILAQPGCCGLCGSEDPPETTGTGSDPAAAVAPLPLTDCKAVDNNIGAWRPSTVVLGRVARAIPNDTCISSKQIAATLASCASQKSTATVEASVEAPGYSACTHTSRALSWNGRNWVSVSAFVGRGAQFHGQSYIYEIVNDQPVAAYTGFQGASQLCNPELASPDNKTSAKLTSDWPSMPADVRAFFCE